MKISSVSSAVRRAIVSGIAQVKTIVGSHEIILPPPERAQHDDLVIERVLITNEQGRTVGVAEAPRVKTAAPLDRYYRRRQINPLQYKAGCILRSCAHSASLTPRVVSDLEATIRSGSHNPAGFIAGSERVAEARERFRDALRAVGPVLVPVLLDVVVHEFPAGDWAKKVRKPAAHGLPTLIVALDGLVHHWALDRK